MNQQWGILKYLFAEIFPKRQKIFWAKRQMKWDLRSKIGVWQMPLFKFLRLEIQRWNLWFDGLKRLKYRVHHFWPKMLWNACDAIMNAGRQRWLDWNEKQRDTQVRLRKTDPTPLGDSIVSLGKMIVYYHIGLEW